MQTKTAASRRSWAIAFRDIARATDKRTCIAAIIPAYPSSAPVVIVDSFEFKKGDSNDD